MLRKTIDLDFLTELLPFCYCIKIHTQITEESLVVETIIFTGKTLCF